MIMNKSLYIVAFSLAFATTGIAQNNEGQDKTVDLGTQTTTELRKTQAVSTISVSYTHLTLPTNSRV